jgi:hypothetical protein
VGGDAYDVVFANGGLIMSVMLDADGKIAGSTIQPVEAARRLTVGVNCLTARIGNVRFAPHFGHSRRLSSVSSEAMSTPARTSFGGAQISGRGPKHFPTTQFRFMFRSCLTRLPRAPRPVSAARSIRSPFATPPPMDGRPSAMAECIGMLAETGSVSAAPPQVRRKDARDRRTAYPVAASSPGQRNFLFSRRAVGRGGW